MSRMGKCIDLATVSANTAGGVWNGGAGTFTASLPGKGSCGGSGGSKSASVELTFEACGSVRVTASGTGHASNALPYLQCAGAIAYTIAATVVSLSSPTDRPSSDPCETGSLEGTGTGEVAVSCGTMLTLKFEHALTGANYAEVNCTFTVEVL